MRLLWMSPADVPSTDGRHPRGEASSLFGATGADQSVPGRKQFRHHRSMVGGS